MGEENTSSRHPGVDGKDSRRRQADPRATWQALVESPYARLALKTGPVFYSALAELISPPENAWLLDVGCDSGELDVALAERFCASYVTGTDLSETHIRRANRLSGKRLAANCSFVRANPSRLPFGEASFDIAIGVAVLRYWQDPRRCLHEMRRVLVPDGLLYLAELDLDHTENELAAITAAVKSSTRSFAVHTSGRHTRRAVLEQGFSRQEAADLAWSASLKSVATNRLGGGLPIFVLSARR